jgi:hypothetical protein
LGEHTKGSGEKIGGENMIDSTRGEGIRGPYNARNEKEVWAKEGRRLIKAASRWHLQGMKLLPKSLLDSNPLGRRTGEEGSVILRKVIRSKSCSLNKSREEELGKRGKMGKMGRGKEIWSRHKTRSLPPINDRLRQKVPAIQAEQVKGDVAPVTAEYVPAKRES